jgi:hypothetical protein
MATDSRKRFMRGAIPTPRSRLGGATPYRPHIGAPINFIICPQTLSTWGNVCYTGTSIPCYGDCVTAEEAFAKACNNPEIFIQEDVAINWAIANNVQNGAWPIQVLQLMQSGGFVQGCYLYDDGPYLFVDWTDAAILQSAIAEGPVKIGVAGDQFDTAVNKTNGQTGWFGLGFHPEPESAEDHCVSLCGFGTLTWLAQQLAQAYGVTVQVPSGVDGSQPGYAVFTWDSIGIIDEPSLLAVTYEAWLRQPTTIAQLRFVPVPPPYQPQGDPGSGIGDYDLKSPADSGFALDFDHSGMMDHIVFYRPGRGAIAILKNNGGVFSLVYFQGDTGSAIGIGGWDLKSPEDRAFAFDYDQSGMMDHIVFYRPGRGAIAILKNNGGVFSPVYFQGDTGSAIGIGDYDLKSPADQAFAFDFFQSGELSTLVLFRPGRGACFIVMKCQQGRHSTRP